MNDFEVEKYIERNKEENNKILNNEIIIKNKKFKKININEFQPLLGKKNDKNTTKNLNRKIEENNHLIITDNKYKEIIILKRPKKQKNSKNESLIIFSSLGYCKNNLKKTKNELILKYKKEIDEYYESFSLDFHEKKRKPFLRLFGDKFVYNKERFAK